MLKRSEDSSRREGRRVRGERMWGRERNGEWRGGAEGGGMMRARRVNGKFRKRGFCGSAVEK